MLPPILMRLLGIAAATALVMVCTLLPFLPGGYDQLAVPLSAIAQLIGTAGLLVVPFSALRLAAERSPRLGRWRFASTLLVLISTTFFWALVFVSSLVHSGLTLGIIVLAAAGYVVRRALTTLGKLRRGTPDAPSVIPLYLTIVPVASALLQLALVERASASSRYRAMRNAAPLIAAIEQHRAVNGRYPISLLSVWRDYSPGLVGIERYQYEPHFDAYNLMFEQFTYRFGTREFVVYNPRDEQAVTAHALDLLQLTPQQLALERQRGHYEEQLARVPHWKYFRFD
jgi:hypothetical protein